MTKHAAKMFAGSVAVVLSAGIAQAQNPHFKNRPPATCTDQGLTVRACGSLAGLGNQDVRITVTAVGIPTVVCTNPGGTQAPGQNPPRITVSGDVTISQDRIENGTLMFCVESESPGTLSGKQGGCPNNNWTAQITDITFSSCTITVEQPPGNVVLQRTL